VNIVNKKLSLFLILACFGLIGCMAVSYPPPLPEKIEIVPPSADVSPEIAAFSGMWEGTWGGMSDETTIIVIEKIDNQKADILFSCGGKTPGQFYATGMVLTGPVIEWKMDKLPQIGDDKIECPCTITLKMSKDSNSITAFWDFHVYNFKVRADLNRRK